LTIETRGLIEPKDVTAVEFECRKCGTRLVLALSTFKSIPPAACSRCQCDWFIHSSQEHARLKNFLEWLKEYAEATNEPYVMRFEVKGLTDAKK